MQIVVDIIRIIMYILLAGAAVTIPIYLIKNENNRVREWLKLAVAEAEKEYGGGTGKLKLRSVYDYFIETFPFLSVILPFSIYSDLVDEALKTLNLWTDTNTNIKNYISDEGA